MLYLRRNRILITGPKDAYNGNTSVLFRRCHFRINRDVTFENLFHRLHHALSEETINRSACFDLGRIAHANSSGYLHTHSSSEPRAKKKKRNADTRTYEIAPTEYSSFGIWGTPWPSTTGEISKAARTEATVIHIDERAMNRPGHIRRPNPKPASGRFTLGSRNRSGRNRSGSGNTDSSCSTALSYNGFAQLKGPGSSQQLTTCFLLRCCLRGENSRHIHRPQSGDEEPLAKDQLMGEGCRVNAHQLARQGAIASLLRPAQRRTAATFRRQSREAGPTPRRYRSPFALCSAHPGEEPSRGRT